MVSARRRGKKKKSWVLSPNRGISPATMRWALVTIRLSIDWRKISVSCTTGNSWEAMRSPSTFPAPTEGSWSQSPTKIRRQPRGRARRTPSNRETSTMESSSTTTASHSKGFCSLRLKTGLSASSHCTCSIRCTVLASSPVSSDIRLAARPVGAANNTVSPFSFKIRIIPLRVVVLPVPGPPVRMRNPFSSAWVIACFCSNA